MRRRQSEGPSSVSSSGSPTDRQRFSLHEIWCWDSLRPSEGHSMVLTRENCMVSQTKSDTHTYVSSLVAFNDTQGKRWVGIIGHAFFIPWKFREIRLSIIPCPHRERMYTRLKLLYLLLICQSVNYFSPLIKDLFGVLGITQSHKQKSRQPYVMFQYKIMTCTIRYLHGY